MPSRSKDKGATADLSAAAGATTPSKLSSKRANREANASSGSSSQPQPPRSPAELTQDALELLRSFMAYVDPDAESQLPVDRPSDAEVPIPISQWTVIYHTSQPNAVTSSITVSSYPSPSKNLFCVQSVLPRVSARQFWTLMAESGNRHLWDSTVQEGGNHRWFRDELSAADCPEYDIDTAGAIAARIEYLRMGAIFMVAKPRDMVLLSADVRLPPTADSPLRMISACRSEVDPSKPPVKGYTRWDLGVGGFMVEELGHDGIGPGSGPRSVRVTQLSDLGELASWVPSSVVKMVASTLVPRSLNLISKVAQGIEPPEALKHPESARAARLRDEHLVKGKERWSKGRGIPLQVGTGVLGREETGSEAVHISTNRPPAPDDGTEEQPLLSLTLQRLSTRLQEASPSPLAPEVQQRLTEEGYFSQRNRHSSTYDSSREGDTASSRNVTTPGSVATSARMTPSESINRFSFATPSGERTVPGSINESREGSPSPTSEVSRDGSQNRLRKGDGPPRHMASATYATEDAADPDATLHNADVFEGASKIRSGPSSKLAPSMGSTPTTTDDVSEEELGVNHAGQLDQRLQRISQALHRDHRLETLSQSFSPHRNKSLRHAHLRDVPELAPPVELETRSQTDSLDDESDDGDEVRSMLAEAVSNSLQSPHLLPHLSPRSPHRRELGSPPLMPYSPSRYQARREASELSAILLAGSDALVTALAPGARRTILPAPQTARLRLREQNIDGSDIEDFALGMAQSTSDGPSRSVAANSGISDVAREALELPVHSCEAFFAGGRPIARRSVSSVSAKATTETTGTHAEHRIVGHSSSISTRGGTFQSEQESGLTNDDVHDSGSSSDGDGPSTSRTPSKRSWKSALRNVPYGLALGMMAMVWASSSSAHAKPAKPRLASSTTTTSSAPLRHLEDGAVVNGENYLQQVCSIDGSPVQASAAVEAARRALQRSQSSSTVERVSPSRLSRPQGPSRPSLSAREIPRVSRMPATESEGRASGRVAYPDIPSGSFASSSTLSIGTARAAGVQIPGEHDERRRRTRENYIGNAKLMTTHRSPRLGDAGQDDDDGDADSGWASWIGSYIKSS